MSETPETDEAEFEIVTELCPFVVTHPTFSRRLEMERDQAIKERDDWQKFANKQLNDLLEKSSRLESAWKEINDAIQERDQARATAKFWQEQYGHANPEHEWEEFVWEDQPDEDHE